MLLGATVVFFLAAPWIIDLYTVGQPRHRSRRASGRDFSAAPVLPQLLAYGAISLMTAVLNTARRFSAPAFTPILNNLVAIGILLAFVSVGHTHSLLQVHHDHRLLLLLGIGTTLGVVIQALALVPSLLTCGLRIRPGGDPTTRPYARSSDCRVGLLAS